MDDARRGSAYGRLIGDAERCCDGSATSQWIVRMLEKSDHALVLQEHALLGVLGLAKVMPLSLPLSSEPDSFIAHLARHKAASVRHAAADVMGCRAFDDKQVQFSRSA